MTHFLKQGPVLQWGGALKLVKKHQSSETAGKEFVKATVALKRHNALQQQKALRDATSPRSPQESQSPEPAREDTKEKSGKKRTNKQGQKAKHSKKCKKSKHRDEREDSRSLPRSNKAAKVETEQVNRVLVENPEAYFDALIASFAGRSSASR